MNGYPPTYGGNAHPSTGSGRTSFTQPFVLSLSKHVRLSVNVRRQRSPFDRLRNCVGCQGFVAGFQGDSVRSMWFKMVSSLRMQAVSATFFGLPAAHSRA